MFFRFLYFLYVFMLVIFRRVGQERQGEHRCPVYRQLNVDDVSRSVTEWHGEPDGGRGAILYDLPGN